jgi:hypothetical protein
VDLLMEKKLIRMATPPGPGAAGSALKMDQCFSVGAGAQVTTRR